MMFKEDNDLRRAYLLWYATGAWVAYVVFEGSHLIAGSGFNELYVKERILIAGCLGSFFIIPALHELWAFLCKDESVVRELVFLDDDNRYTPKNRRFFHDLARYVDRDTIFSVSNHSRSELSRIKRDYDREFHWHLKLKLNQKIESSLQKIIDHHKKAEVEKDALLVHQKDFVRYNTRISKNRV